ncbi:hypothetical protein [Shimia thalassica]|uniref:hypothetical protein n=1 Tax=Shimia thalassica TaxID=1715693 RepID=UPI0026E38A82|nr:hypothetical protein [Shimia thalassica]MDO6797589.1 hypothetical protein [Shimia thalassica]
MNHWAGAMPSFSQVLNFIRHSPHAKGWFVVLALVLSPVIATAGGDGEVIQSRSEVLSEEIEKIISAQGWIETKGFSSIGPQNWSCKNCSLVEVYLSYLGEQACAIDPDERVIARQIADGTRSFISFTRRTPVTDKASCLDGITYMPTSEEDFENYKLDFGGWRTFSLSEYDGQEANEDVRFELKVGINNLGEASFARIVRYDRIKSIFGRMIAQLEGQLEPKESNTLMATYNFALGVGRKFD